MRAAEAENPHIRCGCNLETLYRIGRFAFFIWASVLILILFCHFLPRETRRFLEFTNIMNCNDPDPDLVKMRAEFQELRLGRSLDGGYEPHRSESLIYHTDEMCPFYDPKTDRIKIGLRWIHFLMHNDVQYNPPLNSTS